MKIKDAWNIFMAPLQSKQIDTRPVEEAHNNKSNSTFYVPVE